MSAAATTDHGPTPRSPPPLRHLRALPYRQLLERCPEAIWLVQDGHVRYVNRAARALIGEPARQRGTAPMHLALARLLPDWPAAGGPAAMRRRTRLRRKDGGFRLVDVTAATLAGHGPATTQFVVREVGRGAMGAHGVPITLAELRRLTRQLLRRCAAERHHLQELLRHDLVAGLRRMQREIDRLAQVPAQRPPAPVDLHGLAHEVSGLLSSVLGLEGHLQEDARQIQGLSERFEALCTRVPAHRVPATDGVPAAATSTRQPPAPCADSRLSPRERVVLEGLLSGQRVSEIARTLGLSVKTVSTHKGHIQDKFGVDSLAGLLRRVLAHDSGA